MCALNHVYAEIRNKVGWLSSWGRFLLLVTILLLWKLLISRLSAMKIVLLHQTFQSQKRIISNVNFEYNSLFF